LQGVYRLLRLLSVLDLATGAQIVVVLALGRNVGLIDALPVELGQRTRNYVLHTAICRICVVVDGSHFVVCAVVYVVVGVRKSQVEIATADGTRAKVMLGRRSLMARDDQGRPHLSFLLWLTTCDLRWLVTEAGSIISMVRQAILASIVVGTSTQGFELARDCSQYLRGQSSEFILDARRYFHTGFAFG
jgi:hypothetical protein